MQERSRCFGQTVDSERSAERVKQRIGLMPQGLGQNLYAELSVEENIDFFARLRGIDGEVLAARKHQLLEMTRLERFRTRPMKQLSGGMKQKLGLVCTLIHEPQLIVLDEPTTGVDPVSRREFWDILRDAVEHDQVTVLVSTPYMDEADRCHTVGFMRGGRLLSSGTPRDLQKLVPGVVLEVQARPLHAAQHALLQVAGVRDVQVFGDRLHVLAERALAADALRQDLPADVTLISVRPIPPTMEDVFMHLQRSVVSSQ